MFVRDLYFTAPYAAFLILLTIVIVIFMLLLSIYRRKMVKKYAPLETRPWLGLQRSQSLTMIKNTTLILAWIFACIALMDPRGNIHYSESMNTAKLSSSVLTPSMEVVFLIDTSGSMGVKDYEGGGDRLEKVKEISDDLISHLKGIPVSVYTFSGSLMRLVPRTQDYLFTRMMIRDIDLDEQDEGTHFHQVIDQLNHLILSAKTNSFLVFILLSDGGDNDVEKLPLAEQKAAEESIARRLTKDNIVPYKFITVGVGSDQGGEVPNVLLNNKPVNSKIQPQLLQDLAVQAGGNYFFAESISSWNVALSIYKDIQRYKMKESELFSSIKAQPISNVNAHEILSDLYFQIPLGFALLCVLMHLILPEVSKS